MLRVHLVFGIFCSFAVLCNSAEIPSQRIQWVRSVPTEDGSPDSNPFLISPICMVCTGKSILVSDQGASRIFVFSLSGEWTGTIGKRGQGPGEFSAQAAMTYANGTLVVEDQGNRRVQLISEKGKFKSDFRQALLWRRVVAVNGQLVVNPALPPRMELSPVNRNLIVFDLRGNLVKQFGTPIPTSLRGEGFAFCNRLSLRFRSGQLVCLQYYGNIFRVYDHNFQLKNESVLVHPEGEPVMGYVFDCLGDRLLVAGLPRFNHNQVRIHAFHMDGHLYKEYVLPFKGDRIVPRDLIVCERNGALWFYILLIEPEAQLVIGTCRM